MGLNSSDLEIENGHSKDFADVVDESRAKMHGAPISEPKIRPKRGRGRPRKTESEPILSEKIEAAPVAPPPDVSKLLKTPLQAMSRIPAVKANIPELALTDDEAMQCAESLNEVIKAFVPDQNQMDPKTAAVLGACLTFGSIGFAKYSIYAAKKSQGPAQEKKPTEIQEVNDQKTQTEGISAGDYFPQRRI